ncbi:MAG TPA: VCBS repeat-containing protein, partial [Flavobacteriales bacterium]|nr:VCBS repeat-containing protein [Flavobacteriales bacterium]
MNKILLNCTAATFTAVLISATVHAQTFGPAQNNPFGISTTGTFTSPTFVDLDGDADMDMFSGDADGNFYYFDNAGTVALAAFNPSIMNPFGLTDIGDNSYPTFADLDNDGDLDLMAGEQGAGFHYFENTGSAVAPAFGAAQFCPFGLTSLPTINSTVDLADLDNDGDQDMIAGEIIGNLYYFENTGTATVPSFTSPVTNPFGISPTGGNLTPSFTDLDGDGDFDILTGETLSDFYYFENTGTVSAASYASSTMNPFSLTAIGSYSTTTLADMNNDGLIDLMSGEASNGFYYFEQTNCTPP